MMFLVLPNNNNNSFIYIHFPTTLYQNKSIVCIKLTKIWIISPSFLQFHRQTDLGLFYTRKRQKSHHPQVYNYSKARRGKIIRKFTEALQFYFSTPSILPIPFLRSEPSDPAGSSRSSHVDRDRRDVARCRLEWRSIVLEAKGGIFIFQNFHCESVSGPQRRYQLGSLPIENRPWTAVSSTVVR